MSLILVMILHVLVAIALIVLVLLQRGKGSEMGAAFGAGASGTMFGSQGATPFMVKFIGGLAVVFFCTSLGLNYLVSKANTQKTDILDVSVPTAPAPSNPTNPS
jgi:preprotein translocase subunit SecG